MIIIKIGGGDKINITGIIKDISQLNEKCIVIHGANKLRDELAEKLEIQKKTITSVSGFSSVLSDSDLIDVLLMSYSGLKNKRIVELCQQNGLNAVGLTGIDGGLIKGRKNKGIRIRENGKLKIVHDNSGKAVSVNMELLNFFLENNYLPVITVPILAEDGTALNSENDDITALLSNSLSADIVIHFIEAPGLLLDLNDENSIITHLNKNELGKMIEHSEGRIKRKLYSLKKLFNGKNLKIIIADGRNANPLKYALNGKGSVIE